MSWTKSEAFQFWTAIAITVSVLTTGLTYRVARRQAKLGDPSVRTDIVAHHENLTSFTFTVSEPDRDDWSISRVSVKKPRSGKLRTPEYAPDGGGGYEFVGASDPKRRYDFLPAVDQATLVIDVPGPKIVEIRFTMSLKANPKVTSRCTTQIKIPA